MIKKEPLATLKTDLLKIVLNSSNSLLRATSAFNQWWSFSSIPDYDHNSVLNFVEIEYFSLCRKRCAAAMKPMSFLMILKSFQFILFCVQKMILYQFVVRSSKILFLLMALGNWVMRRTSWPVKIFLVLLLSTLELLQKSNRSTEDGITFPDPVKNPSAFPATINITILLMSSIAPISFWNRTIYVTWFQQLLYRSTTLVIDTLCPISTLNQQLPNLEQTHIRCSHHCEGWTVKGGNCASALHSLK